MPATPRQSEQQNPARPLALEMDDATVGSLSSVDLVVLENVNWQLAIGDYWAIGGLQASGKSDLMATAAGIMPPLRGSLRVFGQELGAGFEHELMPTRLRLGLVFEGGRPLHHLTVAENVALPLRYHQNLTLTEAEAQTGALLDFTGISAMADRAPSSLRRNFQQRIGLARALALKPEILLLDNPLSTLDSRERAWWLDTLDQLATGHAVVDGKPLTLAVTDDNLRLWRERARRFAILKNKKFIIIGNRAELAASSEPLLHELLRTELLKT